MSDTDIVRLGLAVLAGWLAGVAFVCVLFWPRLTTSVARHNLLLRRQLEDAARQLVGLYAANAKLARLLLEAKLDATRTTRTGAA